MAYAKSTDYGSYLTKLGQETTVVRAALDVAAESMNQAFRRARILDVPVVPGDLVKPGSTSQAEFDESIEGLTQWLRLVNVRLAGVLVSTGQSGTGSKLATDHEWAMAELDAVRKNRQRLSLVTYIDADRFRLVRV